MNAITSGTPRKTGKVKFFETLGWTLRRFKATRKRLIEMGETSTVRWDTPKTPMQCRPIDLAQWPLFGSGEPSTMNQPDKSGPAKPSAPNPTRLDEARRIIEEYADNLREIIKKIRQRLH